VYGAGAVFECVNNSVVVDFVDGAGSVVERSSWDGSPTHRHRLRKTSGLERRRTVNRSWSTIRIASELFLEKSSPLPVLRVWSWYGWAA
jgi:hypothetical protein